MVGQILMCLNQHEYDNNSNNKHYDYEYAYKITNISLLSI